MFSPLSAGGGAWRCFTCVYRWPRRGCKGQQCLYYWSSWWPWRGHMWPVEASTVHNTTTGSSASNPVPLWSAARRGTMYIPQSFQPHYVACRGMTTRRHALKSDRSEPVITQGAIQDQLRRPNERHSSGQSSKRSGGTEAEETKGGEPGGRNEDNRTGRSSEMGTERDSRDDTKAEESKAGEPDSLAADNRTARSAAVGTERDSPQRDTSSETSEAAGDEKSRTTGGTKDVSAVIPESLTTDINKTVKSGTVGSDQLPSRVQRYFLSRYFWYLRRFHESLKNEMPDTFNMFHIFTVGLKEFMIDFKDLIKILMYLSLPGSNLGSLSRRELEVYYNMPSDMVRVFPILVLSSLPLGQNVAFPIGYWFPRHLLCYHFWDIKQRHEFAVMGLRKRLFNARPVFRSMQAAVLTLNEEDREKCREIFHKIGSGIHPTNEEIVALIPLFRAEPFHINKIRTVHVNALLRLHGRSVWLLRRRRLREHARILHSMDAAISREGLDTLTLDNLKATLIFRGLNPTNMSTAGMQEYLQNWLAISREVDASSYSLLLHLPILLAYNQPTNFALIYS